MPVPVEDYAYDGEGNRTASHLSAAHLSSDHNQLLEDDNYTYAYDARGNRISRTSKATGDVETYTYDSQNRLTGYSSPDTTATYAYDALDRRIAKTVDAVVTAYIYDMSADAPLAYDDITLEFTDGILTRRWSHSAAVDEPLGFEAYASQSGVGTGAEHAVYADRQGSVIWVTDPATGAVVAGYEYDAYGQITQVQGTLVQPYGYTGREYDAESGLYHYRARAYDPAAGVFLQVDPIEFESGQFSMFSYVGNDPANWVDPEGLTESFSNFQQTVVRTADDLNSNTPFFGVIAASAGLAGRRILEVQFAFAGIDLKKIPTEMGICPDHILDAFDEKKPHTKRCKIGKESIGYNLANMRMIAFEVMVRSAELAMCYEGGARGDKGHPFRIEVLLKNQRECAKYIRSAVGVTK